jgi:hypothetical protein
MGGRWVAVGRFGCVLGLLALAACSGDDDDSPDTHPGGNGSAPDGTGEPCSYNTSYTCVGRGGCVGIQRCGADNLLSACDCDTPPSMADAGTRDGAVLDAALASDAAVTVDAGKPDTGKTDAGDTPPAKHEICDNSKDDDEDGDIDCADSDCGARLCAPKAPAGWSGPTLLYAGDDPPDCKGTYPDEVAHGGTPAPASDADCSACSCEAANVACASVLDFTSGADAACGGVACTTSVTAACTELSCPYLGASSGYVGSALPDHLAQCKASKQAPTVGDVGWSDRMVACAPEAALRQGGCAEGEVCAPKAAFDGDICIVKKGEHGCPSGQYSKRHVYYTRIADTRSCSDCSCGHDCAYTWQIFDAADTTCAGAPVTELDAADQCTAVTPSAGTLPVRASVTGTGACTPSGGDPTGGIDGENPITACCAD